MNRLELVQLLEQIEAAYPGKLKLNEKTVELWFRHLANQDYKRTLHKLDKHIERSPFPPSLHELRETERNEHNKSYLSKMDEWEAQASGPPKRSR